MHNNQENFYLKQSEPIKSCLLTLHDIILHQHKDIKTCWKYRLPMFCINDKMFCYLWIDKKTKEPYIGFVDGNLIDNKALIQGNRKRMKVLPINSNLDIPIKLIENLVAKAITLKLK